MAEEYADTPWWSNLVAVLVTAVVSIVGTIYFMAKPAKPTLPGEGGFGNLVKDTLVYIPHALLLYGVIADMLTQEGVYSIGSLIGILSILPHFLFKFIWKGTFDIIETVVQRLTETTESKIERAGRPLDKVIIQDKSPSVESTPAKGGAAPASFFQTYTGCDIQGLKFAHSPYAPQTLVIIATIFSYYLFDLVKNRGWAKSIATLSLGLFFYVTQLVLAGNCSLPGEPEVSKWLQAIMAAVEGIFVGGVSYTVVQAYFPERLPSSAISPFPKTTPNMLKDGKFDKDGNPWICVNGICYPDMSTAEARKNFADIIAESTGNGRAAVGEDCPAK